MEDGIMKIILLLLQLISRATKIDFQVKAGL